MEQFKSVFLTQYLAAGIGAMPKRDIDAQLERRRAIGVTAVIVFAAVDLPTFVG